MGSYNDLTGKRFGRLIALRDAGRNKSKKTMWLCKCDCGKEKIIESGSLTSGLTLSCGCYQKERVKANGKHGMTDSRIYRIWKNIKSRCTNPNVPKYKYYGGKGVSMCERWNDFEKFHEDMKSGYADDLTIDRIDSNGNYEPSNCRWVTITEQENNKSSNRIIEIDGVKDTLSNMCRKYKISYSTANSRINKMGWSVDKALKAPIMDPLKNLKSAR